MIWQFTGVGPHNKGAELMFLAMRDKVVEMDPQARIVMRSGLDYTWRAKQGLWQLWDAKKLGRLGWLRERLLHAGYRERFGMIRQPEVNVVLDASGFSIGDAWNPEWIEGTAKYYERLRKFGTKIILLPQAFGPFKNPRVRDASRRVLACGDLVFARDSESYAYASDLMKGTGALRQAPDFTNLLEGTLPQEWDGDPRRVAIVPNRKMLMHNSPEISEAYLPALSDAINTVRDAGYRPFVLIHEQGDREIAETLCRDSELAEKPFEYADPLDIKGILGRCAFTIGSRYHGLINALSQAVPSLGTSWSHKYQHLFADYESDECLVNLTGNELRDGIESLLDSPSRDSMKARLESAGTTLRTQAQTMWDLVEKAIAR